MFLGAHSLYYCDNLRAVTACFPDCTIGPQAKGLDRNALQNQMPVVGVSWGMSRLSPAWSPPDSQESGPHLPLIEHQRLVTSARTISREGHVHGA